VAKPDRTLSDDWRAWVVENLLAGVAQADLVPQLVTRGVPRAVARAEIAAVARSPLLAVCARLARRARRLELALALARAHAHGEPDPREVERRATPSADEFYRRYWAAHRPVVLTDVTRGWPALRWTPAMFKERFADQTVEVMTGREQKRRLRMARFIDLLLAPGVSSHLYMVSNNRTMRRKAFRVLLDEVRPPAELLQPLRPGGTSLWIGPAGTVTPLHHDTTNILFCQLHGRKRIELVAPNETALMMDGLDGFYSPVDLDRLAAAKHPALQRMLVKRTELGPGDALYIPAGWWHRVTSLDVSISFSLLGFRRPNDFDWYRPGQAT
jgi:hypothetical protein